MAASRSSVTLILVVIVLMLEAIVNARSTNYQSEITKNVIVNDGQREIFRSANAESSKYAASLTGYGEGEGKPGQESDFGDAILLSMAGGGLG